MNGKLIRAFSKVHGYIYRVSSGKIGRRFGKIEFLLLTTIGRKSGKYRSVPLAGIRHSRGYILVASFGGNTFHPDWFLNIQQNPVVSICVGSLLTRAIASIVRTTDPGYGEVWQKAVETTKAFSNYQRATSRKIPIVLITLHEGR